jgi:oligoribonuclease NrnB/cAMP/cGMP phosphodiesterase (DHH superfamily)
MIIELTEKQKLEVVKLKEEFSSVHSEIEHIKNKMDLLNNEAEILVKDLMVLRESEKNLLDELEKNYGKGKVDPFSLTYIKLEEHD